MGFGSKVSTSKKLPHGNIPTLGFGTWMAADKTEGAVTSAIECGFRHIDCSPLYKNEVQIGNVLKRMFDINKFKRNDIFICSKLPPDMHARQNVSKSVTKSCHDLQVEYLDLFLIEWPIALQDATMNKPGKLAKVSLRETWEAMETLVDQGVVKNIGVSNFTVPLIADILTYCRIPPCVLQVECHVFLPQNHVIDFCNQHNITVVASSPLENPPLACEVCDASHRRIALEEQRVKDIAQKYKVSPAQILLRWNLQRGVVVIPKSCDAKKIADDCHLYDFDINEDDMKTLNSLGKEYSIRTNDPVHMWGIPIFD